VRPLTGRHGTPESIVPPSLKETKEEIPSAHTSVAVAEEVAVSFSSAAPPTSRTAVSPLGPRRWIGGALVILAVLAASWAVTRYRGVSKPAERTSSGILPAIHSLVVLPLVTSLATKSRSTSPTA
jgi:hypothetical protein